MKTDKIVAEKKVFNELLATDFSQHSVKVFYASKNIDTNVLSFQSLQLSRESASVFKEIGKSYIAKLAKRAKTGDTCLSFYDPVRLLSPHEIELLKIEDEADIESVLKPLLDSSNISVFENDQDFIKYLRFYIIALFPKTGDPVFFFRAYTKSQILGQAKKFLLWWVNDIYDQINVPVFLFDKNVDCIYYKSRIFVHQKNNFQKMFDYYDKLILAAREILDKIGEKVPIENFDEFKQACENHQLRLAKLKRISQQDYLDKITIADIKRVIEHNSLSVEISKANKLVFNQDDPWALLKLFDDDYLLSELTKKSYEVNSKKSL